MSPPPHHYDGRLTTLTQAEDISQLDFWNQVKQNNPFQLMKDSIYESSLNAQHPMTQNLLDINTNHLNDNGNETLAPPFSGSLSSADLLTYLE